MKPTNVTRAEFLKKMGLALGVVAFGGMGAASALGRHAHANSAPNPEQGDSIAPEAFGSEDYSGSAHFASRGPGFGNRLAVTFDDGPTPGVTERVLAELEKRSIRATFFMIGQRVRAEPKLARRVLEAGHEIGNHSFTHPQLSKLSDERVDQEMQSCQDAIQDATGWKPVWIRPPYGAFRKNQGEIARRKGLGVVYWSVDPRDWAQPGVHAIIDMIARNAAPGAIVLMHDLHQQTAEAVGEVLDRLLDQEFEFATISGFLGLPYPRVV